MLTVEGLPVDGGAPSAPPDGLWMTVSDIARRKGVSKQAIAKRVDRFASQGLIETRSGPRGAKLVNLAQYDKIAGEASDAIREMSAGRAPTAAPSDNSLATQQARRVAYQADLAKLDLDERLGKLLPVADVEAAMVRCAEVMVRTIEQLPGRADDLAAAVAKEGTTGARSFLKTIGFDLRTALAREMTLMTADKDGETEGEEKDE